MTLHNQRRLGNGEKRNNSRANEDIGPTRVRATAQVKDSTWISAVAINVVIKDIHSSAND